LKLSLDRRINLLIIIISLILFSVTVLFYFGTKSLGKSVSNVAGASYNLESLWHLQVQTKSMVMPIDNILLTNDKRHMAEFGKIVGDFEKNIAASINMNFKDTQVADGYISEVKAQLEAVKSSANAISRNPNSTAAKERKIIFDNQINMLSKTIGNINTLAINEVSVSEHEANDLSQRMMLTQLIVICLALIVGIFMSEYLKESIIMPIRRSLKTIKELSVNLLSSAQVLNENSEHAYSAASQVSDVMIQMADAFSEQNEKTIALSDLAGRIDNDMDIAANGSKNQTRHVNNAISELKDLSTAIDTVATSADVVSSVVVEAVDTAKKGKTAVVETVSGIERISATVLESADKIQALGDKSKQIGEIVEVINGIAEQTNLLALNAAIEAARAGEHGKGFAVVADEVRKLAEGSARSTGEIARLIQGIQSEITIAIEMMNKGTLEVRTGMDLAGGAGGSIEQLMDSIDNIVLQIEEVSSASRKMKDIEVHVSSTVDEIFKIAEENFEVTDKVKQSVDLATSDIGNMAAVTNQSTASVQDMSVNMRRQAESIQMIADASDELLGMSAKLDELTASLNL
jgi:methyl-accepting chemotaxis protein